jgi:hypothetical protein
MTEPVQISGFRRSSFAPLRLCGEKSFTEKERGHWSLSTPVTSFGLSEGSAVLRQRFDIEEELERAGLLHSQEELQVDARSRR